MGVPGLEPGQCFHQRILSPQRLPIPPYPHWVHCLLHHSAVVYAILAAKGSRAQNNAGSLALARLPKALHRAIALSP